MSNREYRKRLQRLLFLIKHQQLHSAGQAAKLYDCHSGTIKRLIARLRLEGHPIVYDKRLKRYVLEEDKD